MTRNVLRAHDLWYLILSLAKRIREGKLLTFIL